MVKPGVRRLRRTFSTHKEVDEITHRILSTKVPPIVAAILGTAMVEYELDQLLRSRFSRKDDDTWLSLTTDDDGPLKTFHSKIIMGFAYRLYDEKTQSNLKIIQNIRNAFAHTPRVLRFDDPDILADLRRVQLPGPRHKNYTTLKWAKTADDGLVSWLSLCIAYRLEFMRIQNKVVNRKSQRKERALKLRRNALTSALLWHPLSGKSGLAAYSDNAQEDYNALTKLLSTPPPPSKKE